MQGSSAGEPPFLESFIFIDTQQGLYHQPDIEIRYETIKIIFSDLKNEAEIITIILSIKLQFNIKGK